MPKNKQKIRQFWFWAALAALLFAAPNTMIIRIFVSDGIDPLLWVILRSSVVFAACIPLIIRYRRYLMDFGRLRTMLMGGIMMSIAVISHAKAIELSSASYVAVTTLAYPIILIAISAILLKEKITRRVLAGISLGALGGSVLLLVPLLISGGGSVEFNALATLLSFVNLVAFAISIVTMRRLNEDKVPLVLQIGVNAAIMAVLAGILIGITSAPISLPQSPLAWLAVLYSGIGVMLFSRWISTRAFHYVGAATLGALTYVEVFAAILLPVFILGERLSASMVIGGMLILAGVYLLEHHKSLDYTRSKSK